MRDEFDGLDKLIKDELKKEGGQIEQDVLSDQTLAKLTADEDLKRKVYNKTEEYEQERLISQLSEKDRQALYLGREVREKQEADTERRIIRNKKRIWKRSLVLAAVLVAVFAMGITSVGGPTRAIEIVKQVVGGREVTKINASSEEVKIVKAEDEEAAYQEIRDKFGIEPVRIGQKPEGMRFQKVEIDAGFQTVHLLYDNAGRTFSYTINCSYMEDSMGNDIEDELIREYEYPLTKGMASVKEYRLPESDLNKYAASFAYEKIYYYMVGTMEQEEFEFILDNLFF